MKKNNVCIFIKPFRDSDNESGNPLALEIITDLYRLGCTANQVKVVNLTPKMLIKHYDELMREGREKIVYSMVGDYVSPELAEKLLAGEKLTEEEMNTPGRPVIVFDMNLPQEFTHYTDVRDDVNQKPNRPTEVVEGSIGNFRKYAIGPTRMLSYFQMAEKIARENPDMTIGQVYEEAMSQYIPASNSIRYKYQYAGDGAKTSFNVMHCSANETDRDFELNNFFVEWAKEGTILDANLVNAFFIERANTTEQIPQLLLNAKIANGDLDSHFDTEQFILQSTAGDDESTNV